MQKELNIVNCGNCGNIFAHTLNVEQLNCPYCDFKSDTCDFQDLYYPPDYNDSIINIEKEKNCTHLTTKAVYKDRKLKGYRCVNCNHFIDKYEQFPHLKKRKTN